MEKSTFDNPEFLKLLEDENFKEEILKQTTTEDLKNLLSKNGINMTDKEIDIFLELLKCAKTQEIDEESLEKISGGFNSDYALGILSGVGLTCSSIGLGLNIYSLYKSIKAQKKLNSQKKH